MDNKNMLFKEGKIMVYKYLMMKRYDFLYYFGIRVGNLMII